MRKSQGLPIHIIIIILLGIIVLAVLLMYTFGVLGTSTNSTNKLFNIGSNITNNTLNKL